MPSSFVIQGIFSLGNGRRVSVPKGDSSTWFCYYESSITLLNGGTIPAEMRIYSPPDDAPLADNSVVYASARAAFPKDGAAILDVFWLKKFNISDDSDLDALPDDPPVTAFGIGVVQAKSNAANSAMPKNCTLEVSKRVRELKTSFPIQ